MESKKTEWIQAAQDRAQWQAFVNTVLYHAPQNELINYLNGLLVS